MILRVAFTNANGTITLVSAANPLPVTGGGGGGGGGAVTVADGADVALGSTSDTAYDGLGGAMTLAAGIRTIADEMLSNDPAAVNAVPSTPFYEPVAGTAKYLVSASPAVLTDYYIYNPHAADTLSVQLFDEDATGDVTLGTTVPKRSFPLGPKQAANLAGLAVNFGVGIVMAAIKDLTGSTAPTTGAVVNLGYRAP